MKKVINMVIIIIFANLCANGQGRFVNPISDISWGCLFPISIGGLSIGDNGEIKRRDTKNPSSPLCLCTKNNIPIPGVTIGFWEPVRLVDITRHPYNMVSLGGIQIGPNDKRKTGGYHKHHKVRSHDSFYHLHYYIYPLIYWLELITDFICLENSTFDLAYMSELDVTWNDEKLQILFNPEAGLFGNLAAQTACSLDCTAATVNLPMDSLFWCAGCLGNLYPLSGANADHVGGVQNSSLLTARIIAKLHKIGLARETSTDDARPNGPLCRKPVSIRMKKSQYKLQMVYPKSSTGPIACWPIGLTDLLYSSGKEYPNDGQDWGYLIWRKKNCCAF